MPQIEGEKMETDQDFVSEKKKSLVQNKRIISEPMLTFKKSQKRPPVKYPLHPRFGQSSA